MIRKTLLAVATVGAMAFGFGGAAAPAQAGVSIVIGTPGYYYGPRFHVRRHHHCAWRVVKVWSKKRHRMVKVRKRVCW